MTTITFPSPDLSFLRDRRVQRRIAVVAVGFAVVGLAAAQVMPRWYRSLLTIVPAGSAKTSSLTNLLGSDLGGMAAGLSPSGGSADATRIAAVLQSIAVSDAVVDKFDLQKRYSARYRESARDVLWEHCEVKALPKPNLVQLSCEDTDPKFVQAMVAFFADIGNQVFRRVSVSSASEEVRFLEKRAAELRLQADETAARMRAFQEQHRIVDLETQAKAVVSSVAALNTQRIAKSMELDYARGFSSSDEAFTRQLQSQLSLVDDKLRDLEEPRPPSARAKAAQGAQAAQGTQGAQGAQRDGRSASTGILPAALEVPKLRAEYEGLLRDRKVAEATLVYVLERLEGAKASEAREVSTFQVLDPPTVPTRKSRPSGVQWAAVAGFLGLVVAAAWEWRKARVAPPASPPASPSR
jgi:tyrosine-protein kinase Etk/Wzc